MLVEPRAVEVLRLQFGALGGLGGGGGVKHEAVLHCGGVVQSVSARILPMVAKNSNFSCAMCVLCARLQIRPHSVHFLWSKNRDPFFNPSQFVGA